jgi:hypothetical protein
MSWALAWARGTASKPTMSDGGGSTALGRCAAASAARQEASKTTAKANDRIGI